MCAGPAWIGLEVVGGIGNAPSQAVGAGFTEIYVEEA